MKIIGRCLTILVLAVGFVACDDDDDDNKVANAALELVSFTPSVDSSVYNRDTIVLTFNKAVRQVEGSSITINGEEITIIINGNVVYCHIDVPTATSVVLNIPAGALIDRYDNQTFDGVTITYNIALEKSEVMVVDCNGNGDYDNITDAIFDVPSSNSEPYIIFVANGTYEELVEISKPYIHLIGQDWENTVITYKTVRLSSESSSYPGAWEYSSRNENNINNIPYERDGVMLVSSNGTNFYAENLSIENKWGVEEQTGPQAEALHTRADCAAFYHCRMRSYQDTWWTRNYTTSTALINIRAYCDNCWIEGSVDYVFGGGNILIENSTFYNVGSQNYITAGSHMSTTTWGYVMRDCTVDGNSLAETGGRNYLGRAWQNSPSVCFINTNWLIPLNDAGWYSMNALPGLFAEYNTTYLGGSVDYSGRNTSYSVSASYSETGVAYTGYYDNFVLTADEAAERNYDNIIKADDNWDPRTYYEKLDDPTVTVSGSTLSWKDDADAVCYLIFKDDTYYGKTTGTSFTVDDPDGSYAVKAVNRYGSLSESK